MSTQDNRLTLLEKKQINVQGAGFRSYVYKSTAEIALSELIVIIETDDSSNMNNRIRNLIQRVLSPARVASLTLES